MAESSLAQNGPRRALRLGSILLAGCIAASIVAGIPVIPGIAGPRAADAATLTSGRLCSGVQASGSFSSPSDTATYKIYLPSGASLDVAGAADIVGRDTTGGWQTILTISPVRDWLLGAYYGGPFYNQGFAGSWVNPDPPIGVVLTD